MHILRPHSHLLNQNVGMWPSNLCFNRPSRQFWCKLSLRTTSLVRIWETGLSLEAERRDRYRKGRSSDTEDRRGRSQFKISGKMERTREEMPFVRRNPGGVSSHTLPTTTHTHLNIYHVISVTTGMMGAGGKIKYIFWFFCLEACNGLIIPVSHTLGFLSRPLFGLCAENVKLILTLVRGKKWWVGLLEEKAT